MKTDKTETAANRVQHQRSETQPNKKWLTEVMRFSTEDRKPVARQTSQCWNGTGNSVSQEENRD